MSGFEEGKIGCICQKTTSNKRTSDHRRESRSIRPIPKDDQQWFLEGEVWLFFLFFFLESGCQSIYMAKFNRERMSITRDDIIPG